MTPRLYRRLSSWMWKSRVGIVALIATLGLGLPLWAVFGSKDSPGALAIVLLWLLACAVVWFAPEGAVRWGRKDSPAGWLAALALDFFALFAIWLLWVRSGELEAMFR